MSLLRALPFLLLGVASNTSLAGVYSWKDADGKVHYGDRPPAEKQSDSRKLAAPPPVDSAATQKDLANRQMADKEKQQKSQDTAKKSQEDQADTARRQEGCQQARSNLAAVESGQVRFTIDAKGERVGLDGAVRDAEIAKARKAVTEWCTPPKPAAK